jgi:branched-chain amino acid transport system permease protein
MLGAYLAFTLTERFSGALGFWGGIVLAALVVAVIGVLVEMLLLRRIYHAPELFQLLATFGLTLMVEDLVVLIWGPSDQLGRRAPGFKGAVDFFGQNVPSYDLFLIALGPVVLGVLWLLFQRTRWGVLVRAATQDRDMVAALGVNQKWLFTSVFAVGVFLAALGGALQIPRDAVNHAMDLRIIVDVFVVVVIGGLGSIIGAFVAAVLVSELNAFGILIFPKISIILVFLVMAVVLIVRPWGLFGKQEAAARRTPGLTVNPWRPLTSTERLAAIAALAFAAMLPLIGGNYALNVASEIAIFAIFAASLHFLMAVGGLASFGHAAYFGLGAYGVALLAKMAGLPMIVYFAMLTLAFAQIVWSIAFQWVGVTGGDNGILGVWPESWAASPSHFYWLSLGVAALSVAALRIATFSPFGFALRATRDSPLRSEAIGIDGKRIQWTAFVIAGTVAGVAGALFAYLKGSVFPDNLGISLSVDALVMVLLGGVETVSGAVVGAIVYKALNIWLVSQTDLSKLVLGGFIVLIVVVFPKGIVGVLETIRNRRRPGAPALLASRIETAE